MKSILLVKKILGLVEMTSGLVIASFSLPKWQAVKIIFFATWFCRYFAEGNLQWTNISLNGELVREGVGEREVAKGVSDSLVA